MCLTRYSSKEASSWEAFKRAKVELSRLLPFLEPPECRIPRGFFTRAGGFGNPRAPSGATRNQETSVFPGFLEASFLKKGKSRTETRRSLTPHTVLQDSPAKDRGGRSVRSVGERTGRRA